MSAGLEKILCMTALALCLQNSAYAQDNAVISQIVEADACDDRQQDFDKQTMEYTCNTILLNNKKKKILIHTKI